MTDKVKIKAIIKQYADKGERLLEEAYENGEHASTTGYWDGYGDCANLLLRELDDMQEEPESHKPKITLGEATGKLKIDDFTRALAECINQAQCAVVDPMAHAEIWEKELLELAKGKMPVSEGLEEVAHQYYKPNETFMDGFKKGAIWQKEQFEKNRLRHCNSITNEQAELEQGFIGQHLDKYNRMPTFLDAIEYGMRLHREQMMEKGVDVVVHIEAGNYPYIPQMELYDYDKDIPLAKEGDKYKVILIKED